MYDRCYLHEAAFIKPYFSLPVQNNQVASAEKEHYELLEEDLILGRQYVVRVRSSAVRQREIWSEWSPVTQWTSTVGLQPPSGKN